MTEGKGGVGTAGGAGGVKVERIRVREAEDEARRLMGPRWGKVRAKHIK